MRIWDLPPAILCNKHLIAEHSELHGVWNTITLNKKGYANHPETMRWRGKLKALYVRHEEIVEEIIQRGFKHKSPLPKELATGLEFQDEYVDSIEEQINILRKKNCECLLIK